jgi:hypothetical protein
MPRHAWFQRSQQEEARAEPTFLMRIVMPFCASGVTRSSVANTVHAKVRYVAASSVS